MPLKTSKKEKVFHPSSRKASQLATAALRKARLWELVSQRGQKRQMLAEMYSFFYYSLPNKGALTMEELHQLVRDVWLTRNDEELKKERAARRKGRPKSIKETKLEELQFRENELYRTGMEVIDLTHPVNVDLFRRWDQNEVAYMEQLRFIRIFSTAPEVTVVSKPGRHISLTRDLTSPSVNVEAEMDAIAD